MPFCATWPILYAAGNRLHLLCIRKYTYTSISLKFDLCPFFSSLPYMVINFDLNSKACIYTTAWASHGGYKPVCYTRREWAIFSSDFQLPQKYINHTDLKENFLDIYPSLRSSENLVKHIMRSVISNNCRKSKYRKGYWLAWFVIWKNKAQ